MDNFNKFGNTLEIFCNNPTTNDIRSASEVLIYSYSLELITVTSKSLIISINNKIL